ncbi:MAG: rhodanese-like domain-containing protein [Candidatus Paracaedimonas acanthamoebae]|uniref:Rhodanese-like domain-containing protein n=1 Tax=Candidatus Paracaedimonas acanthamoebae TaxID=244581 RepID=A0A8J7PS73_9PROT|nr:rhodanese-like domain-containing protein [Candidatus Paracaedimonas acanthamoebae]
MNSIKLFLALSIFLFSPLTLQAHKKAPNQAEEISCGTIDMLGLEALMKAKTPFVLIDARTDKYFDGTLISGATRLHIESTQEEIDNLLPEKNTLIVVYCAGVKCPASKMMASRLLKEGYKNIIDYHNGIREWKAHNKPIEKA